MSGRDPEEREQRHRHWAFPALSDILTAAWWAGTAREVSKGASGLVALGGILWNSAELCLQAPSATPKGQEALLWSGYFYSLFANIFSSLELSIPYNFWQSTAVGNMFKIENTLREISEILCVLMHWLKQSKHSITVILNYFKTVLKFRCMFP